MSINASVVRAGDLNRKVLIQSQVGTQDTFGQQSLTWVDYLGNVPAQIAPLSGNELVKAQAVNSSVTHQIIVRYSALLADPIKVASMRIVYVNAGVTRYFNISSSMNIDERNRVIHIMAAEGVNKG